MPLNSTKYVAFTRQLVADQILRPFQRFFRKQVASSVLLIAATIIALFRFSDSVQVERFLCLVGKIDCLWQLILHAKRELEGFDDTIDTWLMHVASQFLFV